MIKKSHSSSNAINTPTDLDMELINSFALRELQKDEVFSFSVILCDNDIDRDFERFSEESLKTLERLFVGKTGILNHSMKSEDQSCRTYKTQLITDPEKKTVDGKPYTYLKAWCYTVRSEKNDALIRDIESGIKKEVSISCSSTARICSVCNEQNCNHIAGRKYNGKKCVKTIDGITDAYEWSFVAVPAQRKAGVTKAYDKEKSMENILKSIKEDGQVTLKSNELKKLADYIDSLAEKSADGEKYRASLCEKAKKGFAIALPSLNEECVDEIVNNLSSNELLNLCKALKKESEKVIPTTQLYKKEKTNDNQNSQFRF